MTAEIRLSRGLVALVDDEDVALVSEGWAWHAIPSSYTTYAGRRVAACWADKPVTEMMHRLILGSPEGRVDHINGNGLDNRRCNLRVSTPSQNGGNRRAGSTGSSRFKGVSWHKRQQRWVAYIRVAGRRIQAGSFVSEVAAARAYDDAAREAFGEFAALNVPRPGERSALEPVAPGLRPDRRALAGALHPGRRS